MLVTATIASLNDISGLNQDGFSFSAGDLEAIAKEVVGMTVLTQPSAVAWTFGEIKAATVDDGAVVVMASLNRAGDFSRGRFIVPILKIGTKKEFQKITGLFVTDDPVDKTLQPITQAFRPLP